MDLRESKYVAAEIRRIAREAVRALPRTSDARRAARKRIVRPIDYMRCAEFLTVLRHLDLEPGHRVLDVGSPQWFSIYLARTYPDVDITYVNIVPSELEPFGEIARALRLSNLDHRIGDVRDLEYADRSFDRVVSISVLEHVAPEVGGDLRALIELDRVLAPGGLVLATLPYKAKGSIVRIDGPVYDRSAPGPNFFAREYDAESLEALLAESPFTLEDSFVIAERAGILPVDYFEWGPGQDRKVRSHLVRGRVALQVFGCSIDGVLARHYLLAARQTEERLVNISVRLAR